MNIFIDESGNFSQKKEESSTVFSPDCVVAVCLTDSELEKWEQTYGNLGKGSNIKEDKKAQEILKKLVEIGAVVFVVSTNCTSFSIEDVENHRKYFIDSMLNATKQDGEILRESVKRHIQYLKSLNSQLYMKAMLILRLIENVCRGLVNIESKFKKEDLLNNKLWCDKVDNMEKTIKHLVYFTAYNSSNVKPFDFDISKLPDFINEVEGKKYFSFYKFLPEIVIESDDKIVGIKAADCVANFFRRSCRNNLTLEDPSIFKKLFASNYAIDFLHFKMDEEYIDIPKESETLKIPKESAILKIFEESIITD